MVQDEELALPRHGPQSVQSCINQFNTRQRGHLLRRFLAILLARKEVSAEPLAPPVNCALLGQRQGVMESGSHGDKPPPRLRQEFDSPRQMLLGNPQLEPGWPSAPL